jgi:hydroxyquinol 1,2-dioxygenase
MHDTTAAVAAASREQRITDDVLASFQNTPNPRLRELMLALVEHLHAFTRELRLTETEWDAAIKFLTKAGHITDDRRQEFILLSDVLGLSSLTVAVNEPAVPGVTAATVFGPFFTEAAPEVAMGGDIAQGAAGIPCYVSGRILASSGTPITSALIDVWECDEDGFYDVQYADGRTAGRGRLRSGANGEFRFWSVLPTPYPIPHDGPVGALLEATHRGPMRPAHLHFMVAAPGFRTLVTHLFIAGDPHLGEDAVFGVRDELIVHAHHHHGGNSPDGKPQPGAWTSLNYDLILAPEEPTGAA